MSGGHFYANCDSISEFAEELQSEIELNDNKDPDECGDFVGANYVEETVDILKDIREKIYTAGKLAKEVDKLYAENHNEDTFRKLASEIMDGLENE